MGDSGPFSVGEKVLVPHTDKFYEAKVQKAQRREDGLWYYFLHYLGWNKKWDEWVEETGLKRPGEAVVSAPPGGAAAAGGGPSQAGGPAGLGAGAAALQFGAVSGTAAGAALGAAKPKLKQRRGTSGETGGVLGSGGGGAGADSAEEQLQIELPAVLQKQLLDQYDAIHDEGKLLQLPRRPNVMQVFQQYLQYVREKQGVSQAEEDLVAGLQVYFDKALWQCLLYKVERRQAELVLAAGQAPSAVYGAEHLLRLVVKLPELLPQTGVTGEALQLLIRRLEDLLTYLQVQAERIFTQGAYVPAEMYGAAAAAAAAAAAMPVAAVSLHKR